MMPVHSSSALPVGQASATNPFTKQILFIVGKENEFTHVENKVIVRLRQLGYESRLVIVISEYEFNDVESKVQGLKALGYETTLLVVVTEVKFTEIENKFPTFLKKLGCQGKLLRERDDHQRLEEAQGKVLIFISPSANAEGVGPIFRNIEVPIVNASRKCFPELRLTKEKRDETASTVHKIVIEKSEAERDHPLAARLSGNVVFSDGGQSYPIGLGEPGAKAVRIAALPGDPNDTDKTPKRYVIFGYETSERMFGLNARAGGVALGLLPQDHRGIKPFELTPRGWALFDASISWATGGRAKAFDDVYRREWKDINRRRIKHRYESALN